MPRNSDDRLRDSTLARFRRGPITSPVELEILAAVISHHWRSDPKAIRRNARREEAKRITQQLAELKAHGIAAAEAKETLADAYGHSSVEAFEKWRQRNSGRIRSQRLRPQR